MFELLAQTTQQTLEIIRSVEGFYDRAWTKLWWLVLLIGAVASALLGLVPMILERRREKESVREKKQFMAEMESQKRQNKENLDKVEQEASAAMANAMAKVDHHSAMHWYAQVVAALNDVPYRYTLRNLCHAINGGLEAGWPTDQTWWNRFLSVLKKICRMVEVKDMITSADTKWIMEHVVTKIRGKRHEGAPADIAHILEQLLAGDIPQFGPEIVEQSD